MAVIKWEEPCPAHVAVYVFSQHRAENSDSKLSILLLMLFYFDVFWGKKNKKKKTKSSSAASFAYKKKKKKRTSTDVLIVKCCTWVFLRYSIKIKNKNKKQTCKRDQIKSNYRVNLNANNVPAVHMQTDGKTMISK